MITLRQAVCLETRCPHRAPLSHACRTRFPGRPPVPRVVNGCVLRAGDLERGGAPPSFSAWMRLRVRIRRARMLFSVKVRQRIALAQRRLLWWMIRLLPLNSIIRAGLRWYAFSASRAELAAAVGLMRDALIPVCTGALAVAELREELLLCSADGSCPLEVKDALDEGIEAVERELSVALEAALADFDADGDGVVTLAEIQESLSGSKPAQRRLASVLGAATQARQQLLTAQTLVDDTRRVLDEDGDGVITLAEVVNAPRRLLLGWLNSTVAGRRD